jgi:hypothetical protein
MPLTPDEQKKYDECMLKLDRYAEAIRLAKAMRDAGYDSAADDLLSKNECPVDALNDVLELNRKK